MTLSEPCAVGNLFQVKAEETDVVDRLFSSIGVDLYRLAVSRTEEEQIKMFD